MTNWDKTTISAVVDLFGGGTPKTTVKRYWDGAIPWISVVDFHGDAKHIIKTEKCITAEGLKHSSTRILPCGSVIVSARGTVGEIGVLSGEMAFNQSCYGLVAKHTLASNDYLYYLLKYKVHQLKNHSHGSVFDTITRSTFDEIQIDLPPIQEQHIITSILSTLDDKIELNLEMNKTLEDMAMAIYKEWFVDFGPFRDGEFVDSELGPIPKDWGISRLSEVSSKITDGAHLSPKSQDIGMPMASVKDMTDWNINEESCRRISNTDYRTLVDQGCRPLKNDLLIAKDGSFLKYSFVVEQDLNLVLLSSIAIIRPNGRLNPHLLNFQLKSDSVHERLKSIVTGAVIQRIVLKDFREFKIVLPQQQDQKIIADKIGALMDQIWNNNRENKILMETRDYLLPKLISGEIRVKDVEQHPL